MPKVHCNSCGVGLDVEPRKIGTAVKCPKCKNPVFGAAEVQPKKKPLKSAIPWIIAGFGVLGIALLFACFVFMQSGTPLGRSANAKLVHEWLTKNLADPEYTAIEFIDGIDCDRFHDGRQSSLDERVRDLKRKLQSAVLKGEDHQQIDSELALAIAEADEFAGTTEPVDDACYLRFRNRDRSGNLAMLERIFVVRDGSVKGFAPGDHGFNNARIGEEIRWKKHPAKNGRRFVERRVDIDKSEPGF